MINGSSAGASLRRDGAEHLRAVPDSGDAAAGDSPNQLTIEQLAAETGMSVRNIRAHQARGLLHPPEVRQRVGYYGADHVARLRLIAELQADGFNLKGIERLLEGEGADASQAMLSFRRAIAEPFEDERPEMVSAAELAERFGEAATPRQPGAVGQARPADAVGDSTYEVASPKLLRIAEEVVERGVPMDAALEVVQVMQRSSRYVAEAFAELFMKSIWQPFENEGRPAERWPEVLEAIERLRPIASEALVAVFQMTMSDAGRARVRQGARPDVGREEAHSERQASPRPRADLGRAADDLGDDAFDPRLGRAPARRWRRRLARIEGGVQYMSDEVHRMRTGVDELRVEVKGMRGAVDPMVDHLDLVAARVEALGPRLEDMSLAIHPLRRATGKLTRRRNGDPEVDDEPDQTSSGENVSQDAGSPPE